MNPLSHIGLSPNETKCYQALLKIGSSSANEISRKSGIHRVSVYDALRGLREKGLISQITKGNKLSFEPAHPSKITELIKEKEEQLKETKQIIPQLINDFTQQQKQEIHSYKGLAGIKTILQDMLTAKTELLDFGAEYKIKEFLKHYYTRWDNTRVDKKIRMRIVANEKIRPIKLRLTHIKYVPEEFNSKTSTYIYKDKVAIIMWVEEPLGIIIEHKAVAESYKNYFEYLWNSAKD